MDWKFIKTFFLHFSWNKWTIIQINTHSKFQTRQQDGRDTVPGSPRADGPAEKMQSHPTENSALSWPLVSSLTSSYYSRLTATLRGGPCYMWATFYLGLQHSLPSVLCFCFYFTLLRLKYISNKLHVFKVCNFSLTLSQTWNHCHNYWICPSPAKSFLLSFLLPAFPRHPLNHLSFYISLPFLEYIKYITIKRKHQNQY